MSLVCLVDVFLKLYYKQPNKKCITNLKMLAVRTTRSILHQNYLANFFECAEADVDYLMASSSYQDGRQSD